MKTIIPISIIVLLTVGCQQPKERTVEPEDNAVTGQPASQTRQAEIPIYDFEGLERAVLDKENDTTYVVNFWATWCKPCINELPYFEQIGAAYQKEKVRVVLVSLDFPEHMEKKVLPFVRERELASQVVLLDDPDANTWIRKVHPDWQGSIPATLIFNKRSRAFFEKEFTYDELQTEVETLL